MSTTAATQLPVQGNEGRALVATGQPMIRRHRTDPIRLTQDNRICIETTADPIPQAAIHASGERMGASDLDSLSGETAGALSVELHGRGHAIDFRDADGGLDRRVLTVRQLVKWSHCDRPAPIRIEQAILRGPTPSGYRIRFSARQGARAYVAEIQRSHVVKVDDWERAAIGERASQRFDGSPFWSARGDLITLRDDFIEHLFR